MRLKLTFALLCLSLNVFSQDIEWSELMKSGGRGTTILPLQGKDFYTTVYSGGMLLGSLQLKKYDNFKEVAKEKIQTKTPDGTGSINNYIINKGKFVAFISDKNGGMNKLYYQVYDASCIPNDDPKLISEFVYPKGWNRTSYFNVVQSKNKEFFVVEYSIPGKKEENDRFGYTVMNSDFEVISKGEYESPYGAKESEFTNRYISNTGDYFIGMKVYNTTEKGKVRDFTSLNKYVLFLINGEEMEEMELSIGDKRITDLALSSDETKTLTCTGLYGEGKMVTKGAFYFQVDFIKKDIINEGYSEFTKDFVTQDFTERQKEKADKREAKGKGAPQLYSYDFREVQTTADGGIVVVMEQYYVVVTTYTDSKGNTRTTYTYYYNDLITYRVQNDGEFEWINKINKSQVSTNDGGFYSSIGGYFADETFVMYFNDNNKNYSENGSFVKPTGKARLYSASMRKKTNCVAKVEIDLKSGEFSRERYTSREETSALAVPKRFQADYTNNEMFMYFIYGKKEKFGLLKF